MAGAETTRKAALNAPSVAARPPNPMRAGLSAVVAALALFAASPANFLDPIAGFDDYTTLFGWLDAYYGKTLSEGRWVNFLWQYFVGPIDRHAAFLFVILSWCAICGLIAASVFREDSRPLRAILFAVAMAVAPPFAKFAAWSNTVVPVLTVLLTYGMIAAWARPAVSAAALLVFAPIGLMTYTTSPMIMALALALCADWRGLRRGVGMVGLIAAGVALGVLTIYAATWEVHGVFGMVADSWREATAVKSAGDLVANADKAAEKFTGNLLALVHPAVLVGFLMLIGAPFAAYAVIPRLALPIFAVLGSGLGLLMLNFLLSGVSFPLRALPFFWLGIAALFALMAREATRRWIAGCALAALVLMVIGGEYYWSRFNANVGSFQTLTAELGEEVEAVVPGDGPPGDQRDPQRRLGARLVAGLPVAGPYRAGGLLLRHSAGPRELRVLQGRSDGGVVRRKFRRRERA